MKHTKLYLVCIALAQLLFWGTGFQFFTMSSIENLSSSFFILCMYGLIVCVGCVITHGIYQHLHSQTSMAKGKKTLFFVVTSCVYATFCVICNLITPITKMFTMLAAEAVFSVLLLFLIIYNKRNPEYREEN